ncbi:hypothetical protein ACUXPM_004492, partial [Ralstonia sp. 151470066-2]
PNNPHKATPNSLWGGSVFDANPGSGFGANQQANFAMLGGGYPINCVRLTRAP